MPGGLGDRDQVLVDEVIAMLDRHRVEFLVIGGFAAVAHGVQRLTRDLDLLLEPSEANCRRMIAALTALGAEEYHPVSKRWITVSDHADPAWLLKRPRFFETAAGGLDICNGIGSVPDWDGARARALEIQAFGVVFFILDKETLIRTKLAAGREKDLQDVAELGELEALGPG